MAVFHHENSRQNLWKKFPYQTNATLHKHVTSTERDYSDIGNWNRNQDISCTLIKLQSVWAIKWIYTYFSSVSNVIEASTR